MKKHYKLIAGTIVVLAIFGAYFIKQNSDKEYLRNSIECKEIGTKTYASDNSTREPSEVLDPKFYFVRKTKTCLYWGGYNFVSPDGKLFAYYSIKDVYKNNEVANAGNGAFFADDSELKKYDQLYQKYFK